MAFRENKNKLILVVALALIVGSIMFIESGKADRSGPAENQDIVIEKENKESVAEKEANYDVAKEISTPDAFINTEEITINELIGEKIILVDFWTYSCINCQRTLPYLNDWHGKYADDGLVILGIHTPEFEFEKDYENVLRAVEKWGVEYPVILDNDFSTWRSYKNRYWPRKYLIDIDGFIVYDHIGEGGYGETERKIVELINEKNEKLNKEKVGLKPEKPENIDVVDFSQVGSPETYLGSARLERIANLPNTSCIGSPCTFEYKAPAILNTFQLDGGWTINGEEVVLNSENGSIFYRFNANKANLVVGESEGIKAEIYLDGKLVSSEKAGDHVENGVVFFKEADLYNLVNKNGEYSEHLLEIRFLESGIEAFAFTFG